MIAREQDGSAQYYLFNAHGDVTERTDNLGTVLRRYKYDAFGNEQNPKPLDVNPFRYCGEYFDRETGDYYLRARSYDPRTGRFTAEDPARSEANWYPYCGNNPTAFHDPTGNYYVVGPESKAFYDRAGNKYIPADADYRVVKDSSLKIALGIPLQFVPFAGVIPWDEPTGTVGGTSHNLRPGFSGSVWGTTGVALDTNSVLRHFNLGSEILETPGNLLGMVNVLDLIYTKGETAETDEVLFKLIKFYGLPTHFENAADAETQMEML